MFAPGCAGWTQWYRVGVACRASAARHRCATQTPSTDPAAVVEAFAPELALALPVCSRQSFASGALSAVVSVVAWEQAAPERCCSPLRPVWAADATARPMLEAEVPAA